MIGASSGIIRANSNNKDKVVGGSLVAELREIRFVECSGCNMK